MNKELRNNILKNRLKTSSLTGWYRIDPVFAKILIELNFTNYRSLNRNKVKSYAMDMAAGLWVKNGEAIVIGPEGILQDGQHRLYAIIESGATVEMFIIFDPAITNLYNVGLPRNVYSQFKAERKMINSFNIAIGRAIMHYGTGADSFGVATIHDYVDERAELLKTAESIVSCKSKHVAKKAACGALVYCMLKSKEMSETDLRTFFAVVNSGNTFGCAKEASSALVLRKQLEESAKGGGRSGQKTQIEITYKALRDFKFGNQRKAAYKNDTDDAERFIQQVYNSENNMAKAA